MSNQHYNQHRYQNYGHSVITANAERSPDKLAVIADDNAITFSQLNKRVNQVANTLVDIGINKGAKVASLINTPTSIAELYLAEAKIGAIIVALNPYWTTEVLTQITQQVDVDFFIYEPAYAELVDLIRPALSNVKHWLLLDADEPATEGIDLSTRIAGASTEEPFINATAEDTMALFFTSGTTGLPKPVVHTHQSCISMAEIWFNLPSSNDSVWGTGPIIWGVGFPCTMGAALFAGMTVALENDFGPKGFLDAVAAKKITHCCLLPSFWSDMFANFPHTEVDLSSLEMILLGGEPLHQALLEKIKDRVPQAQLFSFYGQTEAPFACIGSLDATDDSIKGLSARMSCAVKVVDNQGDRITEQIGELAISGPNRMREYYGLSDKTDEAVRDDWFFSGDLAIQELSGKIRVLGRGDDVIRRNNQLIKPSDIEEATLSINEVGEAVALGYPEEASNQHLLLILTLSANSQLNEADIERVLSEKLPNSLLPNRIIISDELEHSNDGSGGKGKLLRKKIREKFQAYAVGEP